jgi:hypothetical protein
VLLAEPYYETPGDIPQKKLDDGTSGDLPLQNEGGQYGTVPAPTSTDSGIALSSPTYSPTLTAPPAITNPPGTQAISGAETPYSVNPTSSPATSSLLSRLQEEATRQLDQPTVYDDALFGQIKDASARGINQNYDTAQTHLDAELAGRGINYSSIAGGRILDLNSQRANALSDLDTNLLRERANALASGRTAAANTARGVYGDSDTSERADRGELRTERSYLDQLRDAARTQAEQGSLYDESFGAKNDNDWTSLLSRVFGVGSESLNQANQADSGLGDISEYLLRFLGTGQ